MLNEPGGPQDIAALLLIAFVATFFVAWWVWDRFFTRRRVVRRPMARPLTRKEKERLYSRDRTVEARAHDLARSDPLFGDIKKRLS